MGSPLLPAVLDRRLVFVTGKGGVGRSTVAAALGVLGAAAGRRTIIAELARRDDVLRSLGTVAAAAWALDGVIASDGATHLHATGPNGTTSHNGTTGRHNGTNGHDTTTGHDGAQPRDRTGGPHDTSAHNGTAADGDAHGLAGAAARNGGTRREGTPDHSRAAGREMPLVEGLSAISIDPDVAMEEYLIDQLPLRTVASRLASSRTFGYLAAATPGLRELLAMGKVWELAQDHRRVEGGEPYDLVVVDAPATGHGLGFLMAGRTFAAAASVGPLARQARMIQSAVDDPGESAVIVVTRATETCVGETVELLEGLSALLGRGADAVICNGVEPRRFSGADESALAAAQERLERDGAGTLVLGPLQAARHAARRGAAQRAQVARLRRMVEPAPVTLPHVFADRLERPEIEWLAERLRRGLAR